MQVSKRNIHFHDKIRKVFLSYWKNFLGTQNELESAIKGKAIGGVRVNDISLYTAFSRPVALYSLDYSQ